MPHSSLRIRPPLRTCTLAPPTIPSRPYVPAPSPHRPSTAAPASLHPRPTDHPLPPLRTRTFAPPITHCRSCVPARAGLGIMTMLPHMYPHASAYLRPRPTDHPLPPLRTCPGGAWNYDNVAPYVSTRSYVPAPSPHRPSTAAPAYPHPRPTDHPLSPLRTCALAPPITHCRPCVPAPSPHRPSSAASAYPRPRAADHPLPLLRTRTLAPPTIHCRTYAPARSFLRSSSIFSTKELNHLYVPI